MNSFDEEVGVLQSIYDDLSISSSGRCLLTLTIVGQESPLKFEFWSAGRPKKSSGSNKSRAAAAAVVDSQAEDCNVGYPLDAPPSVALSAGWLDRGTPTAALKAALIAVWEAKRDSCLYDMIEWLKDHAGEHATVVDEGVPRWSVSPTVPNRQSSPEIFHSEVVFDRQNRFAVHFARVDTSEGTNACLLQTQ
jgi:hypothetical protein